MSDKKSTYSGLAWRYGMTNGFSTLLTTVASTYWALFLTGAVGMEPAVMATILSISSTVDLVSIPVCGVVMQKVRLGGGKWGVFRPWLLAGGAVAALCRWLSFTNLGLTGTAAAAWFGGMYILCYLAFNLCYSAFTGILPLMAKDPTDRVSFASARTTCNSVGKFVFSLTSVTLVGFFGQGNDAKGYSMLAGLISILVFVGFTQLFFAAKPYDVLKKDDGAETKAAKKDQYSASFWEMLKFSITKPFVLYLLGSTCKGTIFFIITSLAPYYYSYVVGDKSMLTVYMSASTFLMIGGSFIAPYVSKLCKGSRNTFATGVAIYGACLGVAYFSGANATMFTIFLSVGYVGYSIAHAAEAALYSCVVDYTEWKHDKDLKPFMMTLFSLTPKIGTTVGSMVFGFGLVAVGFNADNVTASAANGIRMLLSGLPAILAIMSVIFMALCPLSDQKVKEMSAELKARREARQ